MADQKISAMPSATTLDGSEIIPLVQGGANAQATLNTLRAYNAHYGAFSGNASQTGSVSAGTAITFDSIDVADGITLVANTRMTVPATGVYNLQFSAQVKNIENSQEDVTIWTRINGVDVPFSAGKVTVPARKTASIYGYVLVSWNIFLQMDANDYAEMIWLPDVATVTLEALPASVSPAHPAIPAIIATMTQVA